MALFPFTMYVDAVLRLVHADCVGLRRLGSPWDPYGIGGKSLSTLVRVQCCYVLRFLDLLPGDIYERVWQAPAGCRICTFVLACTDVQMYYHKLNW